MALHGDIKVNGLAIGFWEAVRMDDLHSVEQVSTYRWRVAVREQAADTLSHAEGLLEHRYDEGALALTQKVLAAYAEAVAR